MSPQMIDVCFRIVDRTQSLLIERLVEKVAVKLNPTLKPAIKGAHYSIKTGEFQFAAK
jgi:hypothetical protein